MKHRSRLTTKQRVLIAVLAVPALSVFVGLASIAIHNQFVLNDSFRFLKQAAAHDLNDPESAQFRNVELRSPEGTVLDRLRSLRLNRVSFSMLGVSKTLTYSTQDIEMCGEINAKNAFGAYVGYKVFIAGYQTSYDDKDHAYARITLDRGYSECSDHIILKP